MRQTEATGYISHLFHLVLVTHSHSYQSVLKPHRLTLLFAAGLGAGQPGRPALLGDPPQTADATASRCAKDDLCLSAMALCFFGCLSNTPVNSQLARLSGRLPATDVSENYLLWIFFPLWATSQKNLLWPVLRFSFCYHPNFLPRVYSVAFASAEMERISVLKLCGVKPGERGHRAH